MKCELCFIINVYLILRFEETYEVMGLECLAHLVGSHWTRNMRMLQKQSGGDIAGWSKHSVILLSAVLPETVNEEFLNSSNVCVCVCVCVCVYVCMYVCVCVCGIDKTQTSSKLILRFLLKELSLWFFQAVIFAATLPLLSVMFHSVNCKNSLNSVDLPISRYYDPCPVSSAISSKFALALLLNSASIKKQLLLRLTSSYFVGKLLLK